MKILLPILFLVSLTGCGGSPMTGSIFPERDRNPPVLLDYRNSFEEGLVLILDESAFLIEDSLLSEPSIPLNLVTKEFSREINITFVQPGVPGKSYKIHFDLKDERGNSNWFIVEYFGPNPRLPEVFINEISPNGSSTRPDMIELFVRKSGNTAGITLFLGAEERGGKHWIFPEMEWQAGEHIILHCRPEGLAEEISEVGSDFNLSGGLRAEAGIRDLWAPEDMNLSGTSGIITLMGSPAKGPHLDRIVYTNRLDNSSDPYAGWTSAMWPHIQDLMQMDSVLRGWLWEGEILFPGEAVWSDNSTSTRTLCRNDQSHDSNRADDWHTVPTSGSTFGFINSNDIYEIDD
jgi:hypothetical protein